MNFVIIKFSANFQYIYLFIVDSCFSFFLLNSNNHYYYYLRKCNNIFPIDVLITVLEFWLGSSGHKDTLVTPFEHQHPRTCPLWASFSLFLGSDGPHQADPSHGDPPRFTVLWLLILQFLKTKLKLHLFFMKPNNLGIEFYQLLEHNFMIPWY